LITFEDFSFEFGLENTEKGLIFDDEAFENRDEKIPFFFFDTDLIIYN
jgi:hypothetical protein